MFSGRFDHTIDDKGRLSIPAKFRDTLQSHYTQKLILTNSLDGCVVAYPDKEWEALQNRVEEADPALREEGTDILRFFYSGATDCPIDRLGRILVPQSLRSFGGIKKNVVIVGMNKKIEMWAEEAWADLVNKVTSEMTKKSGIARHLGL
jgi:MraZ protein